MFFNFKKKFMKKTSAALLAFTLLFNSCTTTLVSANKQVHLEDAVQTNKTYTFVQNNGSTQKIQVTNTDAEQISGKDENGKMINIQKAEIAEVKKNNTLGTVLITVGVVAAAVVIPAYAGNKPVGQ